jgi:hypothetical protein
MRGGTSLSTRLGSIDWAEVGWVLASLAFAVGSWALAVWRITNA